MVDSREFELYKGFEPMAKFLSFNPISPGVLGPGNTPGGAQSAHTQFKGFKLLFDLETLCMLSET